MIKLDMKQLTQILNGQLTGQNKSISGISIDSRSIKPGEAFFAIKGERFDPHDSAQQVLDAGASVMVVERKLDSPIPQILVKDSYKSLGQLAAYIRNQFDLDFIAVTGSNGKTTVKNMIAEILKAQFGEGHVLYNFGNLNSGFGLPLTLARLSEQHQAGVLEMGMSSFGEIDHLTQIVKPKVAMINNVFPCHVEGVGSVEGVAKAKSEIFNGLIGTAVLNRDDEFFEYCKEQALPHDVVTFGFSPLADFTAKETDGSSFMLCTPKGNRQLTLKLFGKHNVKNALAAAACCDAFGVKMDAIVAGLEAVDAEKSRLQEVVLSNDIHVIDDAYNANPASMCEAIDVLAERSGECVAVLGDMKELGPDEVRYHQEIGQYLKEKNIDQFYASGPLMKHAVEAFGDEGVHFKDVSRMFEAIKSNLTPHQHILFKASQSMGFQALVTQVIAESSIVE